jgi:hypothetical protein
MMAAVAAAHIVDAPNVIAQPKVQWRMSTAFPPALDVHHGAAQQLARVVWATAALLPTGSIAGMLCLASNAVGTRHEPWISHRFLAGHCPRRSFYRYRGGWYRVAASFPAARPMRLCCDCNAAV